MTLLIRLHAPKCTEELLSQFTILYPTEGVVRTALRGAAAYQLSWSDAHIWAYAEFYGLHEIAAEDFQADRLYGSVRVRNPFATGKKKIYLDQAELTEIKNDIDLAQGLLFCFWHEFRPGQPLPETLS